jgi:hypothetical protein
MNMNAAGQTVQMTAEAAKVFARHQTIQTVAYYVFAGAVIFMMWGPSIQIVKFNRNKKEAK